MNRQSLIKAIKERKNYLCVGLDPDLSKIPAFLHKYDDPIFEFCKGIIEATSDICVAYKPNLAFFEAYGTRGWQALEKIMKIIPESCFTIADAKRGDIGNTSKKYAQCFFEYFDFDAVTVAPYMGRDSIEPFLEYDNKWIIVLGLTSNKGSEDFELLQTSNGFLFEEVIRKVSSWTTPDNTMFVVGATQPDQFLNIRKLIPDHFLLIPGVGAQGGSLTEVSKYCKNSDIGMLVNNGRNIIYAGGNEDYQDKAREVALNMIQEMAEFLV